MRGGTKALHATLAFTLVWEKQSVNNFNNNNITYILYIPLQHQLDGAPHLTSTSSSSSQDVYLSTSKRHQVKCNSQDRYLTDRLGISVCGY